jgi:hypothetical protein
LTSYRLHCETQQQQQQQQQQPEWQCPAEQLLDASTSQSAE